MLERNRYLVDHTDCLLAIYNGERWGKTAMTVRYARKLERMVIIIAPDRYIFEKVKMGVQSLFLSVFFG